MRYSFSPSIKALYHGGLTGKCLVFPSFALTLNLKHRHYTLDNALDIGLKYQLGGYDYSSCTLQSPYIFHTFLYQPYSKCENRDVIS